MTQQIARQHGEAIKRSAGHAHEHEHQGCGQPVVAAELLPDRCHVCRTELEELLAVELAQPGRQGLLADESQGEGGHGIARSVVGVSMYCLG
jgi:hypothetical protein